MYIIMAAILILEKRDVDYLSNLLFEAYKREYNTIEGAPETPWRIADKLGMRLTTVKMDGYAQDKEDDKPDYSCARGGEEV